MTKKRQCKGTTKAGKRCENAPVTGKDFCIGHLPRKEKDALGFGGPQPGSGRKPLPRPTDVARKLIEENIQIILRPHFRALGHDVEVSEDGIALVPLDGGGAKLYGESREGIIQASEYEDLGAQIAAADKLLDRIYGKARQTTELVGAGGGPVEIVPVSREKAEAGAAVLKRVGAKDGG